MFRDCVVRGGVEPATFRFSGLLWGTHPHPGLVGILWGCRSSSAASQRTFQELGAHEAR